MKALALAVAIGLALPTAAPAQPAAAPVPTFEHLEAAGARIGEIRIRNLNIFDLDDPKENNALFRLANKLHIQTRRGVIERTLLFRSGDPVSAHVIEETERVLRSVRYLYWAQITPAAVHDGVVDVDVETRDTWSLSPSISFGRAGGTNSTSASITEYNLLGTGVLLSFGRSSSVDRSSNELQIANDRAFDGWTSVRLGHAKNSDGTRNAGSIDHPFYSLDARWAAGVSASDDDRIDSVYNAGEAVASYRHRERRAEAYGGISEGRIDGWVRRYSIGLKLQDDQYALDAASPAPAQLPADERLLGPFVRYELIEDRFTTLVNRNQIQRPESFALGLATRVQLGWASTGWGSSRNAWLYAASVSKGLAPGADTLLLASAAVDGQFSEGRIRRHVSSGELRFYLPQGRRWLFFASASADVLTHPAPLDELLLGGDSGLRGYPLRYQSGTRRALFVFEERAYTGIYLWRLFRLGGAVFVDIGRAWGGDNRNTVNPGWLSDVGVGLRIFSVRSAFNNVLHIDVAFPNNPGADVKRVQYLVKVKTSF
jgi:outer membrane protein assembly factor BamA